MESALSNCCLLLCCAAKLCQAGPRHDLPLSLGIEEVMCITIVQEVLWWLHQSSELLAWCRAKVKWCELLQCRIRA
jgi:hypothetical protein